MEPLASPIRIAIKPASRLNRFICFCHILFATGLVVVFQPSVATGCAVAAIALSLLIQYANQRNLTRRIDSVLLGSNDRWSVVSRDGEWIAAELCDEPFISPSLVVLSLRPAGQRRLHIVLTPDNSGETVLRRLRVRLWLPLKVDG